MLLAVDYADGFLFEEMYLGRIGFAALGEMCVMSLIRNCYSLGRKNANKFVGSYLRVDLCW